MSHVIGQNSDFFFHFFLFFAGIWRSCQLRNSSSAPETLLQEVLHSLMLPVSSCPWEAVFWRAKDLYILFHNVFKTYSSLWNFLQL